MKRTETMTVATRTGTMTKQAYGLIAAFAIFGLTNFWDNLEALKVEVATAEPVPPIVKQLPTVAQLTAKLFQKEYTTEEFSALASVRETALLELAKTDPAAAQAAIVTGPVLEKLPAAARAQLEQEVILEGTIEVMHYDIDIEKNLSYAELYLLQGEKRIRAHVPEPEAFDVYAGSKVKLHAFQVDEHNLILSAGDTGTTAVTVTEAAALTAATMRKAVVIMFNFVNDTRQPFSAAQMKSVVFGATNSVNAYDQEVSFGQFGVEGKVDTTGDVLGWYTLPSTHNSSTQPCSGTYVPGTGTFYYRVWSDAAKQMAIAEGRDLTGYNHFIFTFPNPGGCPGSGWAGVNNPDSWTLSNSLRIVAHEHGHNLGAYHASTYHCRDAAGQPVTIAAKENCTISEYGDPFDLMGSTTNHFNNAHKNETKILSAANIRDVTAEGDYTIYPIERSTTGIQALRLPRNTTSTGTVSENYWLEFRQPFGFDNFSSSGPVVNGVSVRLARAGSGYLSANTLLLDTVPATSSFTDAPLTVGKIFDDPAYGWRFQTLSVTPEFATVRLTRLTAECVPGQPTVTFVSPASTFATNGQTLPYNISVTNNDSPACAPATFTVTPTLPAELSQTPSPATFTLNPGATNYTTLSVTSSLTAPAATYAFSEVVLNTATNMTVTVNGIYTVTGPDLTAPTVNITAPANNAKLKGKNFKISTNASDPSSIAKLEILIDGVTKQTCLSTTSCAYTGLVGSLASGAHTITARATDASANANVGTKSITVTK